MRAINKKVEKKDLKSKVGGHGGKFSGDNSRKSKRGKPNRK